jgi:transcriptional regulator with XRE-family HTH domain
LDKLKQAMQEYEASHKIEDDVVAIPPPIELPTASESLSISELKAWRLRYHLSQDALSKRAGVSKKTIANFETGKSKFRAVNLVDVIKAMKEVEAGVSVEQEVSEEKTAKPTPTTKPTSFSVERAIASTSRLWLWITLGIGALVAMVIFIRWMLRKVR